MKLIFLSIFLLFFCLKTEARLLYHQPRTANRQLSTANRQPPTNINRTDYYKALEENNKELVAVQLNDLKTAPDKIQEAYTGAMLMKKASFFAPAATKLHLFREGHKMLEDAIKKDPDNVEFRFLRLIIQEHAPGVLGYKNNLQADADLIRHSYKSLPDDLQKIMTDYTKKSKFLKLEVS